ncbi:hypothetical protein [Nocardioides sp. LHG3406-4]|uniref:hypothetical protein n=1 Tax=Nocardioides sp. LHG3406-4 TaxID=2804575 RepID=UPI003CEB27B5
MRNTHPASARTRRSWSGTLATLVVASTLAVLAPASPAFAAESLTVTKSASDSILIGTPVSIELTATNDGDAPEFNLTFRDELPPGVTYQPGSTVPAAAGEPRVITAGDGRQTLLWENVSDLPLGGVQSVRFQALPDPDDYPVGSTFSNVGEGYANSDARTLPRFDAAGLYTSGATAQDASGSVVTSITAITVEKTEPSPEHELLRGVHDHSTPYTLTVTNNGENPDGDVVLVDLLPAQLEYLGCGTVDNTPADGREYAGAPRLDVSTPDVPGCRAPVSVTTVTDPAGVPAGVYTRVEWNLGTLAADDVVQVVYRAGIPQRANTATFPAGTPGGASLGQVANLDNNTGASTREVTEQALTNRATVTAVYTGPVSGGSTAVTDSDSLTVTAEDLAMQKSVSPTVFTQDGIATYTLELQTSEYADADDIVITDEIPNGLCPLDNVDNRTGDNLTSCAPDPAFAPSLAYASVAEDLVEGGFTVVFQPIDLAANQSRTITYQARMLADYRGPSGDPTVVGDSYVNTVALTAQTTTLAAVEPPGGVSTETVEDDSSATLESEAVVLDKEIQPNTGPTPYVCGTDVDDYADSSTLTPAETTFTEGSRVCFLLRIQFPAGNETKNPVLTDFLPDYVDYEAGSATAIPGNNVVAQVDESSLTFNLGSPLGGATRFVPGGSVFQYRISGIVNDSATATPDVTGNLAKLTWVDTEGEVGFLRDREDFSIAAPPPVSVAKSATRTTSVAPGTDGPLADGGNPGAAGRIRAGEVVRFTVATTNDGTSADLTDVPVVGPDVWDVLPLGIRCADVTAIDNGGVCTDPGVGGHPAFDGSTALSAIRWDRPDAVTIAPGATLAFTYEVTYPSTVAAGATYTNNVDVASYGASSNINTVAQHYPGNNVDTAVPPDQEDVPRAHDDHTLLTPASGVTKTNATQVGDATQADDPGDLANYAAVGETVTYTVTGTVPANTTIYNGVLADATPAGIRVDSVDYAYRAAPGDAFAPLPAGFTGSQTATGPQVELPTPLAAGTAADEVQMTITATVLIDALNVHGEDRVNTAQLGSTTQTGTPVPPVPVTPTPSASSSITVVEPSPAPLKVADDPKPVAGQQVTYTVTARNANAADLDQMRPTLFDSQLVDCVPTGLTVVPGSLATATGTATVGALGANGCSGATPVVWDVGDLAWRSAADGATNGADPWPTLTYVVQVSPQAGGDVAYVNTATLEGTSMNDADADEKTYSTPVSATVTVPGGELRKSVTPTSSPVGGTVTYELEVDLPASVNFYDASIIDTLPAGIAPSSVVRTGFTCAYTDVDPEEPCSMATPTALAAAGQLHGWLLGDVAADLRPRTVTLTYTAVVGVVAGNTAGKSLVNSATLKWNQSDKTTTPPVGGTFDSETDPGTATVLVTEPSLSITKVVSDATPAPGEDFVYTVRVTNASGANRSAAQDVDVVDTLPAGVRVVAGSPSNSGVAAGGSPGGGTITWSDLGPIAPGATLTLTYTARLVSPAPTTPQQNIADVTEYTSLDGGGRIYPNTPSDDAVVTPAVPELAVSKAALDVPAYLGEPARWRITVENVGDAPGFDVEVADTLPTGWTYDGGSAQVSVAGVTPTQVDPDSVTGSPVQTLQWDDLGDLAPGELITIDLTATPGAALAPTRVGSSVVHQNAVTATILDLDGPAGSVVDTEGATAQTRIDAANLTLTKAAVGTPVAGEAFTWTLTVANTGPDTAVGPFVVTDDLPTQVTGATATGTGWTCSPATTTISCQRTNPAATLASGTSLPVITVTAQVPATTTSGTTLINAAAVEGRTYEPTLADNDDEVSVDVVTESDLGIAKTLVGGLEPGSSATYTLAVRNDGPSVSRGAIIVTDTLPAGLTYESFTGTGWTLAQNNPELQFTYGGASPVPLGALPQITVTVQVATDVTAAITNTASVTEPTDPTSGPESPDSDGDTTSPSPSADLGITKDSPGDFDAGAQGVYELVVHNSGPSDAAGPITVTDTLPDELTYVSSASSEAWSCSAAGQDVTCTLAGGLVDGASSTLRLTVDIDETLATDVVNTASVDGPTPDPNPGNDQDTDDTGISVEADLVVAKTLVTNPVVAGENVTYEIAVRNDGPATSPGPIDVTDALPAALTFVSASGTGWSCGAVGQDVTCTRLAALPAGNSAGVITLVAAVASDAGTTTLTNVANVDGPATDPGPGVNTSDAGTTVAEDAEISLVKTTTGVDPVRAGENATFEIAVSNAGPSDARAVEVVDVLPAGLALVSAGGAGWTCTAGVCTRDRIVAGDTAPTITVVARVASGVADGATLVNQATVSTITPGDTPAGNSDDAEVDVVAQADLALTKTRDSAVVTAGLPTTYTISVTNDGPSDAVGPLTITDTLPAGLSLLSAGAPWTCLPGAGADVTCTLPGGLIAGATAPALDLQVLVAADAEPGPVTNTATVDGGTPDPVPANDTDTAEVEVVQAADLSVVKSHTGPVRVGDELRFTLDVANAGPSQARDVVVTDALPNGLTFVSAAGTDWTCGPTQAGVTCTLAGGLAPLTSAAPITVVTTVAPAAYPTVDNVASVISSTTDLDPTDNVDPDRVAVPALVDLAITKKHRGELVVGEQATYDLTVANDGPTAAPGPIVVTDALPAGLSYAGATGQGWTCAADGQLVTCSRPDALGAGETTALGLDVDVLPGAYPTVVNTATVTSPAEETGKADNTSTDTAPVTPTVDLKLAKTVESDSPTKVVYLLAVTDDGPSASVDPIRLRDPLPAALRLKSAKGQGWSCTTSPRQLDCVYADPLPVGEKASVRLVADVVADPGAKIVNVASVNGGPTVTGDKDGASFRVPASGDDGGQGDGDPGDAGPAGGLPDAGGPPLWVGLLGLLVLGLGLALTRRGRRLA